MKVFYRPGILGVVLSLAMLVGNAVGAQGTKSSEFEALVASPDRSDADRQTDQRRQPAKMLAFTGVASGMMMKTRLCQRVAPSTSAASSSSRGMVRKYAFNNQMLNGTENVKYTAINAGNQSSKCRLFNTI